MADEIPPPGPERDAELAEGLGWEPCSCAPGSTRYDGDTGRCRRCGCLAAPPYSTDPAACDRLICELESRGRIGADVTYRTTQGHRARFTVDGQPHYAAGETREDAVSAAALRALRGGE